MLFREGAVLRSRSYFSAGHTRPVIMMATLAPCFSLKKCPPMPAHGLAAPEPAFGNRYKQPVSVEFHADGEVTATGFSFEEYAFAQTRVRKQCGERRLPAPSWAFNYAQLRELLARFWEWRAGIQHPRIDAPEKRLRYAYRRYMRKYVPKFRETLHKLCHELVACTDSKRRRQLEIEIQGTDTQLRTAERGPAVVAAIVQLYYAVGLDSPGVGAELGIHPMAVRQTLWRLHKTWKKMADGTDRKPKPHEIALAKLREKQRRWRAENPEAQREKQAQVQAWRKANPEKFRAQCRKSLEANRDLRNADKRLNYRLNPEQERERARIWAEENREHRRAYKKAWNEQNREHIREYDRNRKRSTKRPITSVT